MCPFGELARHSRKIGRPRAILAALVEDLLPDPTTR